MRQGGDEGEDRYLWLEALDDGRASKWVEARNAEVGRMFVGSGDFAKLQAEIRKVLDDDRRIPFPKIRGNRWYSFRQDADHVRGVWRCTTLDEYRKDEPAWDVLVDLDELALAEGENWVWSALDVLQPSYDRCLIGLSRGGSDAIVVREFDLVDRVFVADGLYLPEAKTRFAWIDADHVLIATDFGPESLTISGYPRTVRLWRRGTNPIDAEIVYVGEASDVEVNPSHDPTPGYERTFITRYTDFFHHEVWTRSSVDGELVRLAIPDDCAWSVHRDWLTIRLRTPWQPGQTLYPAGALLATRLKDYMAGGREMKILFAPEDRSALETWQWTRHHLILNKLVDVNTRLEVLTPGDGSWDRATLSSPGVGSCAWIEDTTPEDDDKYLVCEQGLLKPPELRLGRIGGREETVKEMPAQFESDGMTVQQFFAVSSDGTKVPYFLAGTLERSGVPVLMYAYGGFGLPRFPVYDGVLGRAWLSQGGAYVLAGIRGGGEYGPAWHEAARGRSRHKGFEDLAAVARDLVDRGITSPERLGVEGRSNGGLLTAVMLTRYPELFGAVVSGVPLTDMKRFHKLLAGASWIAEYGNPDDEDDLAYLESYSPYHNVESDRGYPPILLYTSTRDDRVHPAHARKMAAKLLEHGYDVTYYENVDGGHDGAADHDQLAFLEALKMTFLRRHLGSNGHASD